MLGNTNNFYKNGSHPVYEHSVGDTYRGYGYDFHKTIERAMSTKILIWLFNWVGIPAYILSLLNVLGFKTFDDAKQFVLFALAFLFGIARLIVYCVENYQRLTYNSKEEAKRKKWEKHS